MIINEANRLKHIKEYYFSQKLQQVADMNNKGMDVLNLAIGNPDMPAPDNAVNSLIDMVQKPFTHGYQSYRGIPPLRNAIADWCKKTYDIVLDSENEILPLIGSKEGIMHISQTFVNSGDTVLIPNPGYPTYTSVSSLVEAKILYYNLREDTNWNIDIEQIKSMDLEKVKIMWINYPHMPTGAVADVNILKQLIELAHKYRFLICNDNPYSLILNKSPLSIFNIERAKDVALELNSLSKSHNMAGWRLGWIAGKKPYIQSILKFKSNMDSGMFLPVQHAAIAAFQNNTRWHEKQNEVYAGRKEYVFQLLDLLQCQYQKNTAGLFVWAKVPDKIPDVEQFINKILNKAKVFIAPGFIFGSNGKRYIRISLCSTIETYKEAIRRIANCKEEIATG